MYVADYGKKRVQMMESKREFGLHDSDLAVLPNTATNASKQMSPITDATKDQLLLIRDHTPISSRRGKGRTALE